MMGGLKTFFLHYSLFLKFKMKLKISERIIMKTSLFLLVGLLVAGVARADLSCSDVIAHEASNDILCIYPNSHLKQAYSQYYRGLDDNEKRYLLSEMPRVRQTISGFEEENAPQSIQYIIKPNRLDVIKRFQGGTERISFQLVGKQTNVRRVYSADKQPSRSSNVNLLKY